MNIRKYRCYQTLAKTAYLLLKQRKNLSKIQMEMQQEYYSLIVPRATNKSKMVICMLDGRALHGGLSDRLMGIISTYKVCKLSLIHI